MSFKHFLFKTGFFNMAIQEILLGKAPKPTFDPGYCQKSQLLSVMVLFILVNHLYNPYQ